MSMSLQSMIDELLLKKEGKSIKQISDRLKKSESNNVESKLKYKSINEDLQVKNSSTLTRDFTENTLFEDETVISNDDL